MYVHLGGEVVLPVREVVAILDVRLIAGSEVNREFLERASSGGRLHGGPPSPGCKALVVTRDRAVYPSTTSAATLTRRMTHLRQSAKAWDAEN